MAKKIDMPTQKELCAAFGALTKGVRFTTIRSGHHKVERVVVAPGLPGSQRLIFSLGRGRVATWPTVIHHWPGSDMAFCPSTPRIQREIAYGLFRLGLIGPAGFRRFQDKTFAFESAQRRRRIGESLADAAIEFGFNLTAAQRRALDIKA